MNNPICRFKADIRSPIDGKIGVNLECRVYQGWMPGWGPTIVMEFGEKTGIIELVESEALLLMSAINEIVLGPKNIVSIDTRVSGPVSIVSASSFATWNTEDICIWHVFSGHLLPYHINREDWKLIEVALRKAMVSPPFLARGTLPGPARSDGRIK